MDAAYYGNVSHFVNHSCDPNLAVYNVWIDCLDPDLPRLCLFAVRDIVKGEQLNFDYRQRTSKILNLWLYSIYSWNYILKIYIMLYSNLFFL